MASESKLLAQGVKAAKPFIDAYSEALRGIGKRLGDFQLLRGRWSSIHETFIAGHRSNPGHFEGKEKEVRSYSIIAPIRGIFLKKDERRVAQEDCLALIIILSEPQGLFGKPIVGSMYLQYSMIFCPDKAIDRYKILSGSLAEMDKVMKGVNFKLGYTTPEETSGDEFIDKYWFRKMTNNRETLYYFCNSIAVSVPSLSGWKDGLSEQQALTDFKQRWCKIIIKNLEGLSNALGNGVVNGIKQQM